MLFGIGVCGAVQPNLHELMGNCWTTRESSRRLKCKNFGSTHFQEEWEQESLGECSCAIQGSSTLLKRPLSALSRRQLAPSVSWFQPSQITLSFSLATSRRWTSLSWPQRPDWTPMKDGSLCPHQQSSHSCDISAPPDPAARMLIHSFWIRGRCVSSCVTCSSIGNTQRWLLFGELWARAEGCATT